MPFVVICVLVFLAAVGISWLLTPLAGRLGRSWGMVAVPGGRRRHKGIIPRVGGIPLYTAFCIAVLLTLRYPRSDPEEWLRIAGILLGSTLIFAGGLVDDKFQMRGLSQIAGMTVVALLAIPFKVFIEVINNPITDQQVWFPWYVTLPLTYVWLMGSMGTLNLLDGLDGLATGVTAIASLILFIHMLRLEQYSTSLLPLALLGATLGFLPRNSNPAKIFLGSSGAYFLGYALGTLSIVSGAKMATLLLVMGVPILDVAWQFFDRWRRGQPLGLGDRGHLHFRLFDMGISQRAVVFLYYALSALMGSLALLVSSRLYKLVAILLLAMLVIGILAVLSRRSEIIQPESGYLAPLESTAEEKPNKAFRDQDQEQD